MMEDLLATLVAKEREINALNQTVADVVRDSSSRRSATLGAASTTTSHSGRSSKIAEPPVFYADKSKDTVTFEVWHRAVRNKLKINFDYFIDNEAK